MKPLYIFIAACLVILSSCKKEKDPEPAPQKPTAKTKRELLTSGKWVVDHIIATSRNYYAPHDTTEGPVTLHECSHDDTLFFTQTDKFVMHMGQVPCQEPFKVDSTSKWTFINDEMQIEKSAGFSGDVTYTLVKLTEDTLVMYHGFIGVGSIRYTTTYKNVK